MSYAQYVPWKLYTDYSYRIASRGLSSDARRAGKIPVKYPTAAEKTAMNTRNVIGNEKSSTALPPN